MLGEPPLATFWRVTLPLSIPGVVAAVIFGLVGCFGEVAVPLILGGTGYQLVGNAITSALDVLNFPLAAAMSSVAILVMLGLLVVWYCFFDRPGSPLRSYLHGEGSGQVLFFSPQAMAQWDRPRITDADVAR